MVDEIFQWQDLDIQLSQTFSPATSVSRKDFFHGRRAIMRRLIDAANQAGQHAIIYGERGVGKTSLANVLSSYLEPLSSEAIGTARVNCYGETTYTQIWRSLFEQVEIPTIEEYREITLNDVFRSLRREDSRKLILIVDEFDRVQDPDIDVLFADTIKALSDFNLDTTLILVGVADDVDDLITEHESINRCLVQIHLPRMSISELKEIITFGIENVGMEIADEAVSQICVLPLGLPHYVHALGLAAGRAAIDRESLIIEIEDVESAVELLILESQQTVIRAFDLATASPRRQNFYFQALLACALAPTDQVGYFRPADIRDWYSKIMNSEQNISAYTRHLHGLCEEDRGAVLQRLGEPRNYRFRFTDPVLQPYVLMRGLKQGLVDMKDVMQLSGIQSHLQHSIGGRTQDPSQP